MGVVHSLDEEQVHRVSKALRDSAGAIQGINEKFDNVDKHWEKMNAHQTLVSSRIDETLESFALMEDTFNSRIETVLNVVNYATDELTVALEGTLILLSRLDLRKKQTELPKIIIPLAIPLIVLLIELAVANAYLGILLASLPEVRDKYSKYLVGNASSVLIGLSVSLLWLGGYRLWLSRKSKAFQESGQNLRKRFDDIAMRTGIKQAKTDDSEDGGPQKVSSGYNISWSEDGASDEQRETDPSSILPLYQTRQLPHLVSARNLARPTTPTRRQLSPEQEDRAARRQSVEERDDVALPGWRQLSEDGSGLGVERRFSARVNESIGGARRTTALRDILERREERGAVVHSRIRERLASLEQDPQTFPTSSRLRRSVSEATGELEEQVVSLRLRRASQRDVQQAENFSPKASKDAARRLSKTCSDPRRVDSGNASSKERQIDAHGSTGEASPRASGGRLKPHFVKTGGWYFNPLDTQVRWSKDPNGTHSDLAHTGSRDKQPTLELSGGSLGSLASSANGPRTQASGSASVGSSADNQALQQLSQQISVAFASDGPSYEQTV
mmetsp:Transcript_84433/g.131880  ORF Transcript_84433/g.131880 Transcript_84433/m.131880 type:complete len:559 (-) Transcript_84433:21-1697(-)